jgi:hypothetical protein
MVASSLPTLPTLDSVTNPASASDALSDALAAVATASQEHSVPPPAKGLVHGHHLDRAAVSFDDLRSWLREFHVLLAKIATVHAELTSWSVTVGTPFSLTLTVNFADRTRTGPTLNVPVHSPPGVGRASIPR